MTPGQDPTPVEEHLNLLARAAVVVDGIEDIDVAAEIGGPMDDLSTMIGHARAADAVLAVFDRGLFRAVEEVLAADRDPARRGRRITQITGCGTETVETLAAMDLDVYLRLLAQAPLSAYLAWLHTGTGLAAERLRSALRAHGAEDHQTSADAPLTVPAHWSDAQAR